jgi:ABC-type histidine transport system ATPase subunit
MNKRRKEKEIFEKKNLLHFTLLLTVLNGDRIGFMRTKNEVNEKRMRLLTKLGIRETFTEFGCQYIIKIYHYKS